MNNSTTLLILALPMLCLLGVIVLAVVLAAQSAVETSRKKETWAEFAQAIHGVLSTGGGHTDRVSATLGEGGWPLYLDNYIASVPRRVVNYTRMRAFFAPQQPFELVICTPDADEQAPWQVALQTRPAAELGLPPDLLLRTNHETLARELCADALFAQAVQAIRPLNLQIRRRRNWQAGGVSNAIYEVQVQQDGVVTDRARLDALYGLLGQCRDALLRLGLAARSFSEA
jgi:hypothetical protein